MNKYISKYAVLWLALLSGNALADEKVYTLTVTPADVQVIGAGLGQMPYNQVAPLIGKLDAQIKDQDKPKPAPEPPAASEPKP